MASTPFLTCFTGSLMLLFVLPSAIVEPSTIRPSGDQSSFTSILQKIGGAQKGDSVQGLNQLKRFLEHYGYFYNDHSEEGTLTDHFDDNLVLAIKEYQKYHRLEITGHLDAVTIKQMSLPRCGVPDMNHGNKTGRPRLQMVANYTFFDGQPKWKNSRRALTYAFNSSVSVVSLSDARQACASAFQSWAGVTKFRFKEARQGQQPDVVIGFHSYDHGDGYPFDGPGNVLAHAFAPEDGRFHYDGDESWSTDPTDSQLDLQSVALHEIGHLLGLGHSSVPDSVMYPAIGYGKIKRKLTPDDITGIQTLYKNKN